MKKKKIIAIVAAVCVIAVIAAILLPGISSDDQGPTMPVIGPDTGEYISRAEWIEQLGLCFTLNTYDQTAPYYSDVPATHGVFAYVQSCYEWGILRDQQAFEPDQTATRAFVAETAMLALALERNPSIAEKDAAALLQLACDEGILADQNTYGVTAEECEEIIRKLKEVYFDYQPEEYANIKLKENVADYSAADIIWKDEEVLIVPNDVGEKLYVGAIFLAPGDVNGIARKVVSVTTADGKTEVETVTPDIEEVFEELSFSFCGAPTLESIVPLQEGITISPLDEATPVNTAATDAQLVNLSNATPLAMGSKKDPISFSVKVNLTKGSIKPNFGFTDYFSTEASKEYKKLFGQEIPKNAGDIFKKTHTILKYDKNGKPILEKTEEWKGGYEITGELKVKKLYVESTCAKDLNSFSNELHFIVDSSLTIKGELKGSLPVYETKIRGPYGVQIKVVFSLYVDMNGKLTVGAEVEHVTNVTYKNKKFKTTQDTDYEVHADLGADISSGVKGEATVSVLGIDLVDVSAKAGASLDIKATAHQSENTAMICIDGKCYFPVVSVSVGSDSKTVAGKLGIKTTIKLVDKSGALSKSASATLWHYEVTKDGSKNVKKCTWDTYKETVGESSKPTEPAPTNPPATNSAGSEQQSTNPSDDANVPAATITFDVGDHVYFGSVIDRENPDIWQVIHVDGNYALIYNMYMHPGIFDGTIHEKVDVISLTRYHAYGSATWEYSDVRSWLNSRETTVQYQDVKFDYNKIGEVIVPGISEKIPSYVDAGGYLNRFSEYEYNIIQPVIHQNLIPYTESGKSSVFDTEFKNFTIDISQFYQEPYGVSEVSDLMFLLNGWEFKEYVLGNDVCGYIYPNGNYVATFWLRDSVNTDLSGFYGYYGTHMLIAGKGKAGSRQADLEAAIRPACYIDMRYISGITGTGTFENPYQMTINPSALNRNVEEYRVTVPVEDAQD